MHVEYGARMKVVVKQWVQRIRQRGVKIRYLLLDKGFYSARVPSYLERAKLGYLIPILLRGRKKKDKKAPATGMRALPKKNNGYDRQTITGEDGKRKKAQLTINVCVATKTTCTRKQARNVARSCWSPSAKFAIRGGKFASVSCPAAA